MSKLVTYSGRPYMECGYNLYVNNYGVGAVYFTKDKNAPSWEKFRLRFISWHKRKSDGKRYILHDKKSHDLDRLIGKTWGDCHGFKANDGRAWDIRYVDGNLDHCRQDNLEWILRPHKIDANTGEYYIELHLKDADIKVYENGGIYRNGNKETPGYLFIDSDTNQWYATEPYMKFVWQGEQYDMDSLMNMANFVSGDEKMMQNPVILHKDNNFLNFTADNLEWCESTDSRYVEYCKKRNQDMKILVDMQKKQG